MSKKKPQEDLDVLDEVMQTTLLAKAQHQFDAIVGRQYYLYRRTDNTSFVSLVEPEFWNYDRFSIEFICPVIYSQENVWCSGSEG